MKYKTSITITYNIDEFEASDMDEARQIAYDKTNDWAINEKLDMGMCKIGVSKVEE